MSIATHSLADGHSVFGEFRDYPSWYATAQNELAAGHKDTGLRLLLALRHHLKQTPTEDTDTQQLKKAVEATAALWGKGFDWD